MTRRTFLTAGASAAAAVALSRSAFAQTQGFAIGPEPIRYPSGVWKVLDERFQKYMIGNTPLVREWTGGMWAEGPAWNGVGRYVVFSDIPNNADALDEATGKVTQLRAPSNFSNGNTFDYQGRQISCEHQTARVVRYEYQGEPTVLASTFEGKRLNAPNDAIVHPNGGGILFTDPGYGSHFYYEGTVRELELPTSVYHIDAQSARLTKLTDEILKPNGLCFSPDHRFLYVADTAPTHHPKERRRCIGGTCRTTAGVSRTGASSRPSTPAFMTASAPTWTATSGARQDSAAKGSTEFTLRSGRKKIGQIVMPEGTATSASSGGTATACS